LLLVIQIYEPESLLQIILVQSDLVS